MATIPASTQRGGGCACCGTAAETGSTGPATESVSPVRTRSVAGAEQPGITAADLTGLVVCTLDGGLDAMRGRISEWAAVIGRATGREPADGGVTLVYDHDPALTVELARMAAAEFACCSFLTFALRVAPDGVRFTVTAPAEAATVVTALFGTATPAVPAGGNR